MAISPKHWKRLLYAFTTAAALATSVGVASAEEKYTVRPAVPAGMTADFKSSVDSNSTITTGDQKKLSSAKARRDAISTVKEVANGMPSTLELTFAAECTVTESADGQQQQQKLPLAGKTVVVRREADGRVSHNAGEVDANLEAELTQMINLETTYYPKQPVAVGDEWAVDPAKLKAMLPRGMTGNFEMKCRLEKLGTFGGRPTYDISITSTMVGDQYGSKINMQCGGVLQIDREFGIPVRQDLVIKLTRVARNQKVDLDRHVVGTYLIRGKREGAVDQPPPNARFLPLPPPDSGPTFAGSIKDEEASADSAASVAGNTLTIESGGVRHTATRAQAARPEPKPKNPLE
jgi:hypothetical protein